MIRLRLDRTRSVIVTLLAAAVTACGGGGEKTPTAAAPPVPVLTTVTVSLSAAAIQVGQTALATAAGLDQNGAAIQTGTVTWSSSSPTVATISTSGAIAAMATGQTTITGTAGSKSAQATLTVIPVPVASVTVSPATANIIVGATQQLTATTRDASGATLAGRVVTWSTSNENVASVSSVGVVTGVAAGTATITATSEGKSGTAAITAISPVATLTIAISGLPSGAGAAVELAYPDGTRRQFSAGTTLTGLTPGGYTLTATTVRVGTATYGASVASQLLTLSAGDTRSVSVSYVARSNALVVEVVGLPTGTAASVELRGDTVTRTLTAGGTLQDIPVGTYTLSVKDVGSSPRWYASAATRTVTIAGGTAGTVRARYLAFPVSGTPVAEFDSLDAVISNSLRELEFRAATVAVSRGTKVLYARGFGWKNPARSEVTNPDIIMRTGSNTKGLAMACIRALVREGKLTYDTKVFPYLAIPPSGPLGDARLNDITIQQLMDHTGGWDGFVSGDFHGLIWPAARALGKQTITKRDAVAYLQTRPLDFTPGTRSNYSNVGYMVLSVVIEQASGKTFAEYLQSAVLPADLVSEFIAAREFPADRSPREPDYVSFTTGCSVAFMLLCVRVPSPDGALGIELSGGAGSIAFSAPGMAKYATLYWGWGEGRNPPGAFGTAAWTFFGGAAGTLSIFRQMPNGVNFVVLYNQNPERENQLHQLVFERIEAALASIGTWPTTEVMWR